MVSIKRPKHIVSILGMHRSGTSLLTGSLQQCGLELGKHHTWNRHNRKGNRENQDIVDLHDEILAHSDASWDRPPERLEWTGEHVGTARQILSNNADFDIWGFKDPRTLLALPFWKDLCPDIKFVGIFRHPRSTAESLNRRNKFDIETGLALWYRYNRTLLKEHQHNPFPLLCFDWDMNRFHQNLDGLAGELEIKPISKDRIFYSQKLHHHTFRETQNLPPEIRRLYDDLRSISDT